MGVGVAVPRVVSLLLALVLLFLLLVLLIFLRLLSLVLRFEIGRALLEQLLLQRESLGLQAGLPRVVTPRGREPRPVRCVHRQSCQRQFGLRDRQRGLLLFVVHGRGAPGSAVVLVSSAGG